MHQQRRKKWLIFKNDQKNDWLCKIIELCVYEMFKLKVATGQPI